MIIEAIVGVITGLFGWILDALPTLTLPAWFQTSVDAIADAFSYLGHFGAWIPLEAFSTGVTFVLAAIAIAWAIRIGRILVSLFTGGGGSAA